MNRMGKKPDERYSQNEADSHPFSLLVLRLFSFSNSLSFYSFCFPTLSASPSTKPVGRKMVNPNVCPNGHNTVCKEAKAWSSHLMQREGAFLLSAQNQ